VLLCIFGINRSDCYCRRYYPATQSELFACDVVYTVLQNATRQKKLFAGVTVVMLKCLSDSLHEADAHLFRKMANIYLLSSFYPTSTRVPDKLYTRSGIPGYRVTR